MTVLTYPDFREGLLRIPETGRFWSAYLEEWDGDSPGPTLEMGCFAQAVVELVEAGSTGPAHAIVVHMNLGLETGDNLTRDVIATGFLEDLMNALSQGKIRPDEIVPALSGESLRYCRAWDAATGSRTPGIS